MLEELPVFRALCCAATLWFGAAVAAGHGDLHESIERLSQEIEARPESAALHMERANLHAQHEDFEKALADLARVSALEPSNEFAWALRGEVFRRLGRLKEARVEQEAFLKKHPQHPQVRWDYCRTLADVKDTPAALRELDALIAASDHPSPDAVALRLRVAEASGPEGAAQSLAWLNGFLARHPLPVFQDHALDLECSLGRSADALRRLDSLIAASPRKESLLLRKAQVCQQAGDKAGAVSAVLAAQEALARLPAHIRATPATSALMQQLRHLLSNL